MTYFPNYGLLNSMSQHLANNSAPKILDYTIDGNNGYTYVPASTDLVHQVVPSNDALTRQQRFNAAINDLLYPTLTGVSGGTSGGTSPSSDIALRNSAVINSLMNQQPIVPVTNQMTNSLNQTSTISQIEDKPKESYTVKPDETKEAMTTQNNVNLIAVIVVMFIMFMLVQLYLNQKKMEFMMNLATRQGYGRIEQKEDEKLIF